MIYDLVRESGAAAALPDEDAEAKVRWAAGAKDGARAVTNLLAQLDDRPVTPTRLAVVKEIGEFLGEGREGWPAELAATAQRILDRNPDRPGTRE